MDDLEPCPFCGSKPLALEGKNGFNAPCYRIKCGNAECLISPTTPYMHTLKAAIEAWNWMAE